MNGCELQKICFLYQVLESTKHESTIRYELMMDKRALGKENQNMTDATLQGEADITGLQN